MTALTEQLPHRCGFLIESLSENYNFEIVTVASGQTLRAGAVLGKVTATGKYVAYDNAASNGSEVAAAILLDAVNAAEADATVVAMVRGPSVVNRAELVFGGTQDDTAKSAALADLAALNIIAR